MINILNEGIWKIELINFILEKKGKNFTFVHTPKCGGTFFSHMIKNLCEKNNWEIDHSHDGTFIVKKNSSESIKYNWHHIEYDLSRVIFTIIREPTDRFESNLNYLLGEKKPRSTFPHHLNYLYEERDKKTNLDKIVEKMTDINIKNIYGFESLLYYTKNSDILITIEELPDFMELIGYAYEVEDYEKKNVSQKIRGKLSEKNRERIRRLYSDDVKIYNKWTLDEK